MGSAALVIRAGWANLPSGAGWPALYGTSILTGIGFTMSLFIGTLAFGESNREAGMRLGVLVGSALVGILGAIVLSSPPEDHFRYSASVTARVRGTAQAAPRATRNRCRAR